MITVIKCLIKGTIKCIIKLNDEQVRLQSKSIRYFTYTNKCLSQQLCWWGGQSRNIEMARRSVQRASCWTVCLAGFLRLGRGQQDCFLLLERTLGHTQGSFTLLPILHNFFPRVPRVDWYDSSHITAFRLESHESHQPSHEFNGPDRKC